MDDKARFAAVVMPHLDDAYMLARWITGSSSDAEDVVQEACLRAYAGINTFAGGNARAWMLTIVRRTAYTWLGKNRPAALVATDDLDARGEPLWADREAPPDPESALVAKTEGARLHAAIEALPLEFREALVLREMHEMSYREIAVLTDAPIGTVMSRLARGRMRLMTVLRENA